MGAREQIAKLEALLARVKVRASEPRQASEQRPPRAPMPTVPPTPEARALEADMRTEATVEVQIPLPHQAPIEPLESRTRVVEPEPAPSSVDVEVEPEPVEAEAAPIELVVEEDEKPPPSSRRPRPMEAIAEAQKDQPALPPPPESGKLVAAEPVMPFDDDFTGVREASNLLPPLEPNEPSIEVAHVEPPKKQAPHEMEMDLAPPPPPPAVTAERAVTPQPARLAPPTKIEPERTVATVSRATPLDVRGEVAPFKPKNFGELIDATLGL